MATAGVSLGPDDPRCGTNSVPPPPGNHGRHTLDLPKGALPKAVNFFVFLVVVFLGGMRDQIKNFTKNEKKIRIGPLFAVPR